MATGQVTDLKGEHVDGVGYLGDIDCAICLEPVEDRCILPNCFHSCLYVHAT